MNFVTKFIQINTLIAVIGLLLSCSTDYPELGNDTIKKNKQSGFSYLTIAEPTSVAFSAMNYIIKDEEMGGTRYLVISNDLGKTWKYLENSHGDPVFFHIFSNGEILYATTLGCYYIDNVLASIQESQVTDYNGKPFESVAFNHFCQYADLRNIFHIVNGKEIVAWADYSFARDSDPKYIARMWYTTDYGRTVKCAIKFNETKIDGKVQNVRHTHGLSYDPYTETFYIATGDGGLQCQLIKGNYNTEDDTWEFHRLGSGDNYKFGRIFFDKDYAYLITDYTTDLQRGIIKCPKDSLHNSSTFEYLYSDPDNQALSCYTEDKNGNRILTGDYTGKGFIYYANKDFTFKRIATNRPSNTINGFTSPNSAGDIYARLGTGVTTGIVTIGKLFNLTESMRQSGVTNFMVGDSNLSNNLIYNLDEGTKE